MTSITTRSGKGSPLTNAEGDANFNNLNEDKLESQIANASGTNTITLSYSPTVTSYETDKVYTFKAAATNTGAVTLNIDTVGATAVQTIGGSALASGEIKVNQIHKVFYNGTNFRLINQWNSTFIGTTTRDISSTGAQNITGLGFTPSCLILMANTTSGTVGSSIGFADGTNDYCLIWYEGTAAFEMSTSRSIVIDNSTGGATARAGAVVSSLDSDGFTLTWTHDVGSPTGTATLLYKASRIQ
jgi:hypothetical protein